MSVIVYPSENVGRVVDEVMTVVADLPAISLASMPDGLREAYDRTGLVETAARAIVLVDALDRLAQQELLLAFERDGIV